MFDLWKLGGREKQVCDLRDLYTCLFWPSTKTKMARSLISSMSAINYSMLDFPKTRDILFIQDTALPIL